MKETDDTRSLTMVLVVYSEEREIELIRNSFEASPDPVELAFVPTIADAGARIAENPPDIIIADRNPPDGKGTDLMGDRWNPSESRF